MHELAIAESIVEQATRIARENQATRVIRLSLEIGPLSGVVRESLEFCFPIVSEGTLLENAQLVVCDIPLKVLCRDCGKDSEAEIMSIHCRNCNSVNVEITAGKNLTLKNMEVE